MMGHMFEQIMRLVDSAIDLMHRGGPVMWPLALVSVVALVLIIERLWYWLTNNNPKQQARLRQIGELLRTGQRETARQLIEQDASIYGYFLRHIITHGSSDAVVEEAIERMRHSIERFMTTLGTIITAAPMLGILGTVTGIITSFHVLSGAQGVADPEKVGAGIAEALLTTVFGLAIALIVVFPFNAYRTQIDRTFSRMEALIAALRQADQQTVNPPSKPVD